MSSVVSTVVHAINGIKECMSDSVTNYNYVGNTKVSVAITIFYANKCKLRYDHPGL